MRRLAKFAVPLVAAAVVAAGVVIGSGVTTASAAEVKSASGGVTPSIVGGRTATENYPLVAMGGCTGSLIEPGWILTAAHCGELFQYRIGTINRSSGGKVIDGGGWGKRHPKADVMLLNVAAHAKGVPSFTRAKFAPNLGQPTRIVGWGLECPTPNCGQAPETAKELDTSVVADSKCVNPELPFAPEYEFCVNNPGGNQGACFGDSGGPMLKKVDGGKWAVIGVTSRPGDGQPKCAGAPSIYTDITAPVVRDWIDKVLKGQA